jgi:DnaK suppressor protein
MPFARVLDASSHKARERLAKRREQTMKTTEIQRFKDRLLDLREQVRGDIQASIDAVAEEVRPVGEDAKESSEGLDKELVLERNAEEIYHATNAALRRIEKGIFGQCTGCGQPIPEARLEAIPFAALCVDCERRFEEEA